MAFDPRRQLKPIADDIRRHRDTLEKLNHPSSPRLFQAATLLQEAAALIAEEATVPAPVERFSF